MNCLEFETKIIDFLYDELDESGGLEMKLHMQKCARCEKNLGELKDTQDIVSAVPDEDPPYLQEKSKWKELFWNTKTLNIAASFIFVVSVSIFAPRYLNQGSDIGPKAVAEVESPISTPVTAPTSVSMPFPSPVMKTSTTSTNVMPVNFNESFRRSFQSMPQTNMFPNMYQGVRKMPVPQRTPVKKRREESIQTRWHSTQPFIMRAGQHAILPTSQGRLVLKEILHSPCEESTSQCNWSGVGAVYEFDDFSNQNKKIIFSKKTAEGFAEIRLNETYTLEILEITPQTTQTVVKTAR